MIERTAPLPEPQSIFGAESGMMLHVVKETEETLQTLKADLGGKQHKQQQQNHYYSAKV